MARRIRAHDWAATSLGPVEAWPQSLRTAVELMLVHGVASAIHYGPRALLLYNDAWAEMMGARHPEALGRSSLDVFPEARALLEQNLAHVRRGESLRRSEQSFALPRDGWVQRVWVAMTYGPLRAEDGQVVGAFVLAIETTEQHQAHDVLRASEARYRPLMENVRDHALFLLDDQGRVTEWTLGAQRVKGYSAEEVLGRHVSLFFPPEPVEQGAVARELSDAAATGRAEHEGWHVRKDGSRFWGHEITTALRDEHNRLVGFSKVTRDLSEHRRLEQQREELLATATAARGQAEEAQRAKDEFLAILGHELRTPLTPLLLWSRMMRSGRMPLQHLGRAIDAIVQCAESQSRLIEDLLDLARVRSGTLLVSPRASCPWSIVRAAHEIIAPTAQAKGVSLEVDMEPGLGRAVLDPVRLQQILWNLLSNAVKFTPAGGRVSVRVRKHAGQFEVEVADTGQGIAAEFLPYLFQRFRQADMRDTREHMGLGIGLAFCRHLVELHGGTIQARSEGLGRGSVFTVRLPWVDAAPEEDAPPSEEAPLPLNGLGVLLVEHEAASRDALRRTLEGAGARVIALDSAPEALGVLEMGASEEVEVIVCALDLPGMEGPSFIERVNASRHDRGQKPLLACAVSPHGREAEQRRALAAGFAVCLTAPVGTEALIEALEQLALLARRLG